MELFIIIPLSSTESHLPALNLCVLPQQSGGNSSVRSLAHSRCQPGPLQLPQMCRQLSPGRATSMAQACQKAVVSMEGMTLAAQGSLETERTLPLECPQDGLVYPIWSHVHVLTDTLQQLPDPTPFLCVQGCVSARTWTILFIQDTHRGPQGPAFFFIPSSVLSLGPIGFHFFHSISVPGKIPAWES